MKTQLILDMPDDEYHAIDALSATGIKLLHAGPLEYFYYRYGPGSEEEATAAMRAGSAKHKAGLEGLEAFQAAYVPAICKEDFTGVLDSQEELKGWCRDHGLAVGGSKVMLCARIIEALDVFDSNHPTLWMIKINEQKNIAQDDGQEILTQDEYKDALSKARQIAPIIDPLREQGGKPEVTILFEQDGIPCKARIDYLAPGILLDLKNIQNSFKSPFSQVISKTMANSLLPIQAEFYLRAIRAAAKADLLPFAYKGSFVFRWLFLQSTGCPNMAIRQYLERSVSIDTGTEGLTASKLWARDAIKNGMNLYREYQASHGKDRPWIPPLDEKEMEDIDYPSYLFYKQDDSEVEL